MKIYQKREPEYLIRLQIIKQGFAREHLTLSDTTLEDTKVMVEKVVLEQNISPFEKGLLVNVNIREYQNGKNGKAISVSFRGFDPIEVLHLLEKHLNK